LDDVAVDLMAILWWNTVKKAFCVFFTPPLTSGKVGEDFDLCLSRKRELVGKIITPEELKKGQ
jgi:hypothetical protein